MSELGVESPFDFTMTPESMSSEQYSNLATIAEESSPSPTPGVSSEKKPTKKRKSWGQVLPEPKTNLPPRKRAKTDDEKEQRRVERVLRNRRAAQSSRERKRQEVEKLEETNKQLQAELEKMKQQNLLLLAELERSRGPDFPTLASRDHLTLSQPLFYQPDGEDKSMTGSANSLKAAPVNSLAQTVNPDTVSPELGPVSDSPSTNTSNVVRPAVSSIGGDVAVNTSFASIVSTLGGTNTLVCEDRSDVQSFDGLPGLDSTSLFDDSLEASPVTVVEDDFAGGAMSQTGQHFDLGDFLNLEANPFSMDPMAESNNAAADYMFAPLLDPENLVSTESLFSQQLPPGASTLGCDVGRLAVGY